MSVRINHIAIISHQYGQLREADPDGVWIGVTDE